MGLSEAGEILRRHVIERRHRVAVESLDPEQDPRCAVPRMNDAQFADSCLLVRGVPNIVLAMLEAWYCDSAGATWTVDAVQMPSGLRNIPIAQVAQRLTLREAAYRVGLPADYKQARTLYMEAMSRVTDNLIERAKRDHGPSAP
jgi:hypothetical protein